MEDRTWEGRQAKALERIADAAEKSLNILDRIADYVVAINDKLASIKSRM